MRREQWTTEGMTLNEAIENVAFELKETWRDRMWSDITEEVRVKKNSRGVWVATVFLTNDEVEE